MLQKKEEREIKKTERNKCRRGKTNRILWEGEKYNFRVWGWGCKENSFQTSKDLRNGIISEL
jgi:hypothetical protein